MLVRLFEMHNLQTQVLAKMVLCQWLHNLFFTDFTASKTEVEQHLKSVYSRTEAEQREVVTLPPMKRPTAPGCAFDMSDITIEEVQYAVAAAQTASRRSKQRHLVPPVGLDCEHQLRGAQRKWLRCVRPGSNLWRMGKAVALRS